MLASACLQLVDGSCVLLELPAGQLDILGALAAGLALQVPASVPTGTLALGVRLDLARRGALTSWGATSRVVAVRSTATATNLMVGLELPQTTVHGGQWLRLVAAPNAQPPAAERFWACPNGELATPELIPVADTCLDGAGTCPLYAGLRPVADFLRMAGS